MSSSVTIRPQPASADLNEKNQKNAEDLSQAKDRAQLTATTAMSIVHVTILKDLLVAGPEGARFFYANIVLVSLSLALQVLAGLISLGISHLRAYFTKHRSDPCEDLSICMCCCRVVYKKSKKTEEVKIKQTRKNDGGSIEMTETMAMIESPTDPPKNQSCCPCFIRCTRYNEEETNCFDEYEHMYQNQLQKEINASEAKLKIESLKVEIARLKRKIAKDDSTSANHTNTEHGSGEPENRDPNELESNKKLLEKAKADLRIHENKIKDWEVSIAQTLVMQNQVKALRESHILKLAMLWQHCLNYILYAIFIINAFIAGLGVASYSVSLDNKESFNSTRPT